jgi:hypothetical protein
MGAILAKPLHVGKIDQGYQARKPPNNLLLDGCFLNDNLPCGVFPAGKFFSAKKLLWKFMDWPAISQNSLAALPLGGKNLSTQQSLVWAALFWPFPYLAA